jgi:hypothetical protein
MGETHDFDRSAEVERRWSPVLDRWIRKSYAFFREATDAEQRRGIDRIAIDDLGHEVAIDYKCDERAQWTGNVFMETVSVDTRRTPGWLYTSDADWILYFVVPEVVYAFSLSKLRAEIEGWIKRYREVPAKNRSYRTLGVLVPLREARRAAEYVASISADCAVLTMEEKD